MTFLMSEHGHGIVRIAECSSPKPIPGWNGGVTVDGPGPTIRADDTMKLVRDEFNADGIFGKLFDEHGDQIAVTLEHSFDGKPKLPAGHYVCQRGKHRLAHGDPFETFEVMDVPGHTGILFHQGNWNKDSDGCILLGRVKVGTHEGPMIASSAMTFAYFMNDLDGVDQFPLTVEDGVRA